MDYSPRNFPSTFSQLVSEATASLPPLIKPEHDDMLVIALEEVIDAFWNQYIDMLPAEGKQAFLEAKEDESGQKLIDWNYDYANFPEDDEAEKRGAKVLTDIAERLPEMLKSMYDDVEAATQSTTA